MTAPVTGRPAGGPPVPVVDEVRRRRGPGRKLVAGVATVLVVAAVVAGTQVVHLLDGRAAAGDGAAPPAAVRPPATAPVTLKTLRNEVRLSASVVHAAAGTLTAGRAGTVTWLPARGTVLSRGAVAYRVDDEPVLVLFGALPPYRDLRPDDEGSDVRQLQANLRRLGYGGFAVDGTYTTGTRDAVKRWLKANGIEGDGSLPRGRVAVLPGPRRVGASLVPVGKGVLPGDEVLKLQLTVPRLEAALPTRYKDLAGRRTSVRVLVDGRKAGTGRVVDVRKTSAPDGTVSYRFRISTAGSLRTTAGRQYAVVLVRDEAKDVLTVPVTALLSVPEGYAVDVYAGGRTRRVVVDVGLFTDDDVEVRSAELQEGMAVTVPQL